MSEALRLASARAWRTGATDRWMRSSQSCSSLARGIFIRRCRGRDSLVAVVAAGVRVPVGRLDLDDAFADLEDRDVERPAAEVVDGDRLVLLLVPAVGQGGGRPLVGV